MSWKESHISQVVNLNLDFSFFKYISQKYMPDHQSLKNCYYTIRRGNRAWAWGHKGMFAEGWNRAAQQVMALTVRSCLPLGLMCIKSICSRNYRVSGKRDYFITITRYFKYLIYFHHLSTCGPLN